MSFDYSALRGRIVEKYGTNKRFAEKINMAPSTLSMKLGGNIEWKQKEIEEARVALGLSVPDISKYFFCLASSENRTK